MIFGITFLGNAQNTVTVDASAMQNRFANIIETPVTGEAVGLEQPSADSGSNHAFEETVMSQTIDSDYDVEPKDEATLGSDVVKSKVLSTNDKDPIKLSAHPNPVNSVWNLRASENITRISLKNTLGQNVYDAAPNTLYWAVDMSQLKAGVYMANVSIGGSSTSIKLIKE